MKIILAVALVALPCSAHAVERNLFGVGSFEFHGTFVLPAPDHASIDGTQWTSASGGGGVSAGIGFARSFGLRLRVDKLTVRAPDSRVLIDAGIDLVYSLGNPDTLLWRPFAGLAWGHLFGQNYLVTRAGIDMIVPLSNSHDAPGLLVRAAVDGDFGSSYGQSHRIFPAFTLSLGFLFDVY